VNPTAAALLLAVPLAVLGGVSGYMQVRGMRRLRGRKHVPSDEAAYLRGRHRRRLIAAGLMVVIAGLIAGSYLFGLEAEADALAAPKPGEPAPPAGEPRAIPAEDKAIVRFYAAYWAGVIVLTCGLMMIAVSDAWATRRYWLSVYTALRDEHNAQLRRDLAVYRQQRQQERGRNGYGGRLGDG
jgi:hypothetical protein